MIDQLLGSFLGPAMAQGLNALLGDGFFAVGVPLLLRLLIRSKRFPWIDQYSERALKISAGIAAAIVAAGIKSTLDIGAGTFVVEGITVSGLGLFAAEVIKQLGLQELAYQYILKGRNAK